MFWFRNKKIICIKKNNTMVKLNSMNASGPEIKPRSVRSNVLLNLAIISLRKTELAQGYTTFFMLNSAEHEFYPAYKC